MDVTLQPNSGTEEPLGEVLDQDLTLRWAMMQVDFTIRHCVLEFQLKGATPSALVLSKVVGLTKLLSEPIHL